MIYKVATALALVAAASASLFVEDHASQKSLWESFKTEFGKSYTTMEEEQSRFAIFVENLKLADRRNELELRAGGSAVHGVSRFSDLSQAEFEARYLTSDYTLRTGTAEQHVEVDETVTTTGLIDWTTKMTTSVRDQGYCGSCWAFSATEQIESDHIRQGGSKTVLSVEQVTQCTTGSYGCNGGYTEKAYSYVVKKGGITTDAAYPYTSYSGTTGTCHDSSASKAVSISGYKQVSGESAMGSYVSKTGPLSVCVDASTWSSYKSGIMSTCGKSVNHCVQAVGVDTTSYWKVRNSWGTSWGESGFIRLKYGQNTCAVASDATYTYK